MRSLGRSVKFATPSWWPATARPLERLIDKAGPGVTPDAVCARVLMVTVV
jgi:hypothetical protein